MKFLIFPGYGDYSQLPKQFLSIFEKNKFPYNRMGEIIEFLEKQEEIDVSENSQEIIERLKKDENLILKFNSKNIKDEKYYYYDRRNHYLVAMQIIDVNTNIPWKLDEYDGAEGIVYYKEPKIINKDINMAEF